ncbi:biotin transporter BioY [Paeniglutamicibacter psychrophenolicus]|uniref:biotin transporter BioY n=1 Tax=Paeniglutamicibacter psychrophenolicus TaxID=257454 RepID=UPI002787802F|nr:biotin transporter BioY [Paeniglutamicibacter psychrophenolicus]MDQ0094079.1 biotin transport system substrate-specific component [Paeniglutamicibacter psychrophenolicus]
MSTANPRLEAQTPARIGARDLALVSVFAALIAVLTLVPAVPVGALGVPITLQTMGVALTAMILGSKRGGSAVGLYLVVGLAGVPIFAKFSGGLGSLAAPSAGYLLSFPIAALVTGALATLVLRKVARRHRFAWLFVAGLAGSILVVHPLGILGMSLNAQIPLGQAFILDMAYWPGDVVKNLLAAAIAVSVFKAFPAFAARRFQA